MTFRSALWWTGPALVALALSGCATAEGSGEGLAINDPYEPFNRTMLKGNIRLDRYVLRPAAQAYDFSVPETLQFVVGNELDYLSTPVDFFNYLLQGEFRDAGASLARFVMNTTLGGLGFLDPATEFGLVKRETDFGITLGKWGVAEGPYLVLPLVGPAMARELPSYVVDRAFSPLTYVGQFTPLDGLPPAFKVAELLETRSDRADLIDQLFYETQDPYVTLRAAYLQRRRAQLAGAEGAIDNLPDIFDDETPAAGEQPADAQPADAQPEDTQSEDAAPVQ